MEKVFAIHIPTNDSYVKTHILYTHVTTNKKKDNLEEKEAKRHGQALYKKGNIHIL